MDEDELVAANLAMMAAARSRMLAMRAESDLRIAAMLAARLADHGPTVTVDTPEQAEEMLAEFNRTGVAPSARR